MICLLAPHVRKIHILKNGRRVASIWRPRNSRARALFTGRWVNSAEAGVVHRIFHCDGRVEDVAR